ncbi:MAG: hypothetical protein K9N23_07585 [Akkermansiaceae bacterium]|nr:hypothetical protein [Akkermansiaceae bacterium]
MSEHNQTIGVVLAITFILAAVAARATGETDITPVGPMGQLTQLVVGGGTTKVLS